MFLCFIIATIRKSYILTKDEEHENEECYSVSINDVFDARSIARGQLDFE